MDVFASLFMRLSGEKAITTTYRDAIEERRLMDDRKRKLNELAEWIASNPQLFMLDEPLSLLDKKGERVAVILSPQQHAALLERLRAQAERIEILNDPERMARNRATIDRIRKGEYVTLENASNQPER